MVLRISYQLQKKKTKEKESHISIYQTIILIPKKAFNFFHNSVSVHFCLIICNINKRAFWHKLGWYTWERKSMSELLSQDWSFIHSKLWAVTISAVCCGWCWNSKKSACGVSFGSFVP
jgi:hypothetical protein